MFEIERKFRIRSTDFLSAAVRSELIAQGYLNSTPERTVRIRIKGEKGYITIKGKANVTGTTRLEWEKEIPKDEALQLLELCEPGKISKTRHYVPFGGHLFEVDVFEDENDGLIVAEIELSSEDEKFDKPDWLGEEVTGDPKFYNANLGSHPYSKWINSR